MLDGRCNESPGQNSNKKKTNLEASYFQINFRSTRSKHMKINITALLKRMLQEPEIECVIILHINMHYESSFSFINLGDLVD